MHAKFPNKLTKTPSQYWSSSSCPQTFSLVCTLERRHGLALGLVQSGADDLSVGQVDLAVRLLLERESVLHPVLVVTVRVILAGVSTTRLLSVGSRLGGLDTIIMSVLIHTS